MAKRSAAPTPSPLTAFLLRNIDVDEVEVKRALKEADHAAVVMLAACGAFPRIHEVSDEFNRAVEHVGRHFGLQAARVDLQRWLKRKGVDLQRLEMDDFDRTFPVDDAIQHSAYMLGLAVGIRIAGGARGNRR